MKARVKRKKEEEELPEEQQWYRIKMARYYEEEIDKAIREGRIQP